MKIKPPKQAKWPPRDLTPWTLTLSHYLCYLDETSFNVSMWSANNVLP